MSNSTTQSNCQHRFLVTAIACFADRPGRYPYESGWNIGSRIGSMARLTTVCAMRSDTVGMPSFLVPPFAFGISTCLTGGGKYDPDDIRFHSLYRFRDRFWSNIAMVSSSMPAAPRLALTCWYASHTSRFAITKDFVDFMSLIPAQQVGGTRQPDNAAPSLHSRYRRFIATMSSPRPSFWHRYSSSWCPPFVISLHIQNEVLTFHTKARAEFMPPIHRLPPGP